MADIKVKDLSTTSSVNTSNKLMVLTDDAQNTVQNVTVDNLLTNIISANANNSVVKGTDNKLFVQSASTTTGNLANLNTSSKTNLVSAVNEVNNNIGNLSNLDTVDKSNVVSAINEALSVLSPTQTADYINNSKGLLSGDTSTNSIVLSDVTNYAHSTFNGSAFSRVGSPVLSNDGIASDFSTSKYIRGTYTLDVSKAWEVTCSIITGTTVAAEQNGIWSWATNFVLSLYNNNKILFQSISSQNIVTSLSLDVNSKYYIITGWDLTDYYVKVYDENYALYDSATYTNSTAHGALTGTRFAIGINGSTDQSSVSDPFINGSIDLKGFSIKSEGLTVYSGNQTGIDEIKPDSFTVEGSPTITPDGVVSGFNSSSFLYVSNTFAPTSYPYEVTTKFQYSANSVRQYVWYKSNYEALIIQNDNNIQWRVPNAGNTSYVTVASFNPVSLGAAVGDYIYVKCIAENSSLRKTFYSADGINWTITGVYTSLTTTYDTVARTYTLGATSGGVQPVAGAIDLNGFKISVGGNLVFQGCLKIPYTESKTGSKVTDSLYRDRIYDMYSQQGYAPYYSLSSSDYTLPHGELYGFINRAGIKKAWIDGYSWYLILNNDFKMQGGLAAIDSTEQSWGQPTLTGSASIGGSAFGVESNAELSNYYIWHLFDGSQSTLWGARLSDNPEFTFYNPTAIKVTNLTMANSTSYFATGGTVQGSNDNSTWTSIKTWTNSNIAPNATWDIDLSSNSTAYKYYKVTITSGSGYLIYIRNCQITASITITSTNEIAFFQNFSNDRYSYTLTPQNASGGAYYVSAKSVSGLTINSPNATQYSWTACGY